MPDRADPVPMPWTYRHASREWRAFLEDAKNRMDLSSDNMAYIAIDGVFRVFRRRLTVAEALGFANVLPSVPRAIFVRDWDVTQPPVPFASRAELVAEAQALRPHHNLTPASAIEATAYALWRSTDHDRLTRVLVAFGPQAEAFWAVPDVDPSESTQRII